MLLVREWGWRRRAQPPSLGRPVGEGLLEWSTVNLGAENNRSLFSHSSGGLRSKIHVTGLKSRCRQGCASSRGSGKNPLPVSPSCQRSLACGRLAPTSMPAPSDLSPPIRVCGQISLCLSEDACDCS